LDVDRECSADPARMHQPFSGDLPSSAASGAHRSPTTSSASATCLSTCERAKSTSLAPHARSALPLASRRMTEIVRGLLARRAGRLVNRNVELGVGCRAALIALLSGDQLRSTRSTSRAFRKANEVDPTTSRYRRRSAPIQPVTSIAIGDRPINRRGRGLPGRGPREIRPSGPGRPPPTPERNVRRGRPIATGIGTLRRALPLVLCSRPLARRRTGRPGAGRRALPRGGAVSSGPAAGWPVSAPAPRRASQTRGTPPSARLARPRSRPGLVPRGAAAGRVTLEALRAQYARAARGGFLRTRPFCTGPSACPTTPMGPAMEPVHGPRGPPWDA